MPFDKVLVEGDWTRFKKPEEIKEVFKVCMYVCFLLSIDHHHQCNRISICMYPHPWFSQAAGVDLTEDKKRPIVTSCGSGVTGAVLSLAMVGTI